MTFNFRGCVADSSAALRGRRGAANGGGAVKGVEKLNGEGGQVGPPGAQEIKVATPSRLVHGSLDKVDDVGGSVGLGLRVETELACKR